MIHVTREGKEIKLRDLDIVHLENILNLIERRAIKGVLVRNGGSGVDVDECWYDEEILYGEDAKEELEYYEYKAELIKRNKNSLNLKPNEPL